MPPPDEEQDLLNAICDDPKAHDRRLVLADWLGDEGQDHVSREIAAFRAQRAEFIRTQIELEKLPESAPQRPALEARECELLPEQEKAWRERLSDLGVTAMVFGRNRSSATVPGRRRLRRRRGGGADITVG